MIIMQSKFRLLISAVAMGFAATATHAADRTPQGVAPGIEKPLLIAPRPGNGRNSEGDFIQLKDGRLLLVYSKFIGTGDHAPAELVGRYSSDGGKTWGTNDVQVIARKAGEANLMSVSLLRLQDKRIALLYVQKYDSPPGSKYAYLDYILMRTSADEGATWSEPTYVVPKDKPGYRVLNNDRVVQLKGGRLVVPLAVHYLPGWSRWESSAQMVCYLSDDAGKTWRPSKGTLRSELLAQEPGVVQLKDDGLLMFCRSRDCQLVSRSNDGGETWSALKRSKFRNRQPRLLRLNGFPQRATCCWFGTTVTIRWPPNRQLVVGHLQPQSRPMRELLGETSRTSVPIRKAGTITRRSISSATMFFWDIASILG
jgi:hypothetical protein